MILTQNKAILLFEALEEYCKKHLIHLSHYKSVRLNKIAKIIIHRYNTVILLDTKGNKYLCNNAKYLKKWAYGDSLKNAGSPFKFYMCDESYRKSLKDK